MGAHLSKYLVKHGEYDPDKPMSRIDADLKYEEKLLCHNYYATRAKYNMMEIYGCVFGTLGTTMTPNRWHFTMRLLPFCVGFFVGLIWDMRRIEDRCMNENDMCEEVVKSHQMMIASGHPPYSPVSKNIWTVEEDKWKHLRTPPMILRRELIENWKYTQVKLPKERDDSELTADELQNKKIQENQQQLLLRTAQKHEKHQTQQTLTL